MRKGFGNKTNAARFMRHTIAKEQGHSVGVVRVGFEGRRANALFYPQAEHPGAGLENFESQTM